MPGKRSSRKKVQRFYCPYCSRRLWSSGNTKHFLFYLEASEIQKNRNMPRLSAEILASKGAYVDTNSWIEEFFCGEHGQFWMKVIHKDSNMLVATLATREDWQQTTHAMLPEARNPSVTEIKNFVFLKFPIPVKTGYIASYTDAIYPVSTFVTPKSINNGC